MAYSYEAILQSQYQSIADEQAQAAAELEAGRLQEDAYRTQTAADRILDLDQRRMALDVRARGFAERQQAPQQGNRWGLNSDEVEIARSLSKGDNSLNDDQRLETYARNKARYQQARRDGSYRDDQGRVTR